MWINRERRFDGIGTSAILARRINDATVETIADANSLVKHYKQTKELELIYLPIDPGEACTITVVDGAGNKKGELHAQGGHLVGVTTKKLVEGGHEPVNLLIGRCGEVERTCPNPLAVEAKIMEAAVSDCEWVQQACGEMSNASFHPSWIKFRMSKWNQSTAEKPPRLVINGAMIYRDNSKDKLKENLAVTDTKSLYDGLKKEAKTKEQKIAISIGVIKQGFAATGMQPRWAPHNVVLADALTKELQRYNLQPLMKTMATGKYKLTSEEDEIAHREHLKATGQTLQRQKGKTLKKGFNMKKTNEKKEADEEYEWNNENMQVSM